MAAEECPSVRLTSGGPARTLASITSDTNGIVAVASAAAATLAAAELVRNHAWPEVLALGALAAAAASLTYSWLRRLRSQSKS
jgi:hypothetical protein